MLQMYLYVLAHFLKLCARVRVSVLVRLCASVCCYGCFLLFSCLFVRSFVCLFVLFNDANFC